MSIKIRTKQSIIDGVAEMWKHQYGESNTKEYQQLCALVSPTEEQIANIIGNSSWTENECTECRKDFPIVIQIGDDPDYDSDTVWLCTECLQKALRMAISLDSSNSS